MLCRCRLALREVHAMMNEWDGKTRTERRTRKTITRVVRVVETAMNNVAIALTNGQPTGSTGDGGEGDGEDEEKKEE